MEGFKIKKPNRCQIRSRQARDESESGSEEEDPELSSAIEEAKELRKMRKRPNGVNIEDLATLKSKPKEVKAKADPLKLKTGGFVDVKTLKRELSAAEDIEQIGTSFAIETNRCDVDLPMNRYSVDVDSWPTNRVVPKADRAKNAKQVKNIIKILDAYYALNYIEEELAKRKGGVKSDEKSEKERSKRPEDALYELPEHIKSLTSTSRKKTEDMISNTMLSGIPEVDLGIEAKIRNIEATEEAKQRLLKERRERKGHRVSDFVPTNVAVNFVQHDRYNIEDNQPKAKKIAEPKPLPVRVGDTQPNKNISGHKHKRNVEKATDDFHFEKFRKSNRRF